MTPEQQKHLLELVPTQALYRELLGRYDHAIFYGLKDGPERILSNRWKGDAYLCLGMANRIMYGVNLALDHNIEGIAPSDL